VEVRAWTDASKTIPAQVIASQRVLTNSGTAQEAFNEVPGVPASELSSRYVWTWYDQQTSGALNWVLVANPEPEGGDTVTAEISFKDSATGQQVGGTYDIAPGQSVTPTYAGHMGGPVEVKAYKQGSPGTAKTVIASQRSVWGPSFEEVPGYPYGSLATTYFWTWYDQQSAGALNWVLVANAGPAPVTYQISVGGQPMPAMLGGSGTLQPGQKATPTFPGVMGGPVEVTADGNVIVSQRVSWNGYFNEVTGIVLD
jgi:hypothetical protein